MAICNNLVLRALFPGFGWGARPQGAFPWPGKSVLGTRLYLQVQLRSEPGTTRNKFSKWSESVLSEPGIPGSQGKRPNQWRALPPYV